MSSSSEFHDTALWKWPGKLLNKATNALRPNHKSEEIFTCRFTLSSSRTSLSLDSDSFHKPLNQDLFFGRLPPEIRNMIYEYAFPTNLLVHLDLSYRRRHLYARKQTYVNSSQHAGLEVGPNKAPRGATKSLPQSEIWYDQWSREDWRWWATVCHSKLPLSQLVVDDACTKGLCNMSDRSWGEVIKRCSGWRPVEAWGFVRSCRQAYTETINLIYRHHFKLDFIPPDSSWLYTFPDNFPPTSQRSLPTLLPSLIPPQRLTNITALTLKWHIEQYLSPSTCWSDYAALFTTLLNNYPNLRILNVHAFYKFAHDWEYWTSAYSELPPIRSRPTNPNYRPGNGGSTPPYLRAWLVQHDVYHLNDELRKVLFYPVDEYLLALSRAGKNLESCCLVLGEHALYERINNWAFGDVMGRTEMRGGAPEGFCRPGWDEKLLYRIVNTEGEMELGYWIQESDVDFGIGLGAEMAKERQEGW